jgi:glyoxylase I family protein
MQNDLLPSRLHHLAHVTRDQAATRVFYEDLLGLPLIATWCENEEVAGARRTYCHTFYGIGDGGAIAFFQFADPKDHEEFCQMAQSRFSHIALKCSEATQNGIRSRLEEAGYKNPKLFLRDHGYCKSLYVVDPNGLRLEFTVDLPGPEGERVARMRLDDAHAELTRWLAGDHRSNNMIRG